MFGVAIQAGDARGAIEQAQAAEAAGVEAIWATMGGAGGADMLPVYAAIAVQTERVKMGTAILHTWPRHPVIFAQELLALDQLAPGRFRLGIGPTTEFFVTRLYGRDYDRPLTNLREYLITLRALLAEGQVEFEGFHVRSRGRIAGTADIPVMASALRPKSYELCGELSDGAISWMSPLRYVIETALPAMEAGAAQGERDRPPLVAHVPIAVDVDVETARARAREQLSMYARVPNYQGMFVAAGYDVSDGYSDELLDDLVVSGAAEEVAAGLHRWRDAGVDEVLAQPLFDREDRAASIALAFEAVALATSP